MTNYRHLNNITELACYLTNRPQCIINLLTDKSQFSKNKKRFDVLDKEMLKEIARDINLCQYISHILNRKFIY